MILVPVFLAGLLGAPPALPAADAYDAGRQAYQRGDYAQAKANFETALGLLPPGDPLRGATLYNLARSAQQSGDGCGATTHFQVYLSTTANEPDERRRRTKAQAALAKSEAACQASSPTPPESDPVEPTDPTPDRLWAWVATGGAGLSLITGVALVGAASGDVAEADKAYERFLESGRRDTVERDAVRDARDSAESNSALGYTFLGVGAVLAGVSVWLWLDDEEALSLRVGSEGAVAAWRF